MSNFEIFDFSTSSLSKNSQLGQRLMGLKMNGYDFLQTVDAEKYRYTGGGFPESAVNQLMWFAYQMGKEDGNRLGYIEGRSARIDEFRKMMASVMEELDMIPNEDCGIGF
jgi:hypothetical protein